MARPRINDGQLGNITVTETASGAFMASAYYRDGFGGRTRMRATAAIRSKATTALKKKATQLGKQQNPLTPTGPALRLR